MSVVEEYKWDLYTHLRARFSSAVAKAITLKVLNICLAKHHFHARSVSVASRPIGLLIDPSNACRLACPGCVHSAVPKGQKLFDWPNGTLSQDRLSRLLKLYGPSAIGVNFYNYGEPLLNLNTPKFITQAKSFLLRTGLSTSLSVQRFDAEAYVESGLDFMLLSIDGATQPVYERFRRRGKLELVLHNIRKLVEAKRRLGRRAPVLVWVFLAFEHNVHEIALARRLARKLNVNRFWVRSPFEVSWDDPSIRPAAVQPITRRFDWPSLADLISERKPFSENVDAKAIADAFEGPWYGQPARNTPPRSADTCHWLYKNVVMDATGRIMPCCGSPRPNSNLVFGTIETNGEDPFNTEKHREARSFFSTGTRASVGSPYCTQCDWDHTTVSIGAAEIRSYFRAADAGFFDARSRRLLSGW